jgi:hypothetical protein
MINFVENRPKRAQKVKDDILEKYMLQTPENTNYDNLNNS